MSYNVLSLRLGVANVAAVIRAVDPDVVCMQEAPRFLGGTRRCAELARATGLSVVTGGRPAAANMLLARPSLTVERSDDVRLPWHPPKHRRGLAVASFGAGVTVASTHLSLDPAERLAQARAVLDLLAAYGSYPVVLAGDVNEPPGGPAFAALAAALPDAYVTAPRGDGATYSAKDPRERIDAVFADRRLAVAGCGVPDVPGLVVASDHRPLVADLDL